VRKVYTVVKGSRETILLQSRYVSNGDPFPLTNVTSLKMRVENDDGTLEEITGQIVDSVAGKMSFILTPTVSADLKAKDAQTIEVEIGYDDATLKRIFHFENALCVKEALSE